MKLSELTAYAIQKYGIEEKFNWDDFPGYSTLTHPHTGKWVALLMRQYDSESGQTIEHCDLKCGAQILYEIHKPYLSSAIRMQNNKWISVAFTDKTEPDVVFSLFDRAIHPTSGRNTIILGETYPAGEKDVFRDTPLSVHGVTQGFPEGYTVRKQDERRPERPGIPPRILEMIHLYVFGDGSEAQRAENFYRQGKFMEDYEDDVSWDWENRRFLTYHDLNVRQLRGYFSWRTQVRKGKYLRNTSSMAYLYLYELLCGIGTVSPEDALQKMDAFEEGFLNNGMGDPEMRAARGHHFRNGEGRRRESLCL